MQCMVLLYLALPKTEAVDQVRALNNFRNTIEAGSCAVRNITIQEHMPTEKFLTFPRICSMPDPRATGTQ
jgi:hypothetical protein